MIGVRYQTKLKLSALLYVGKHSKKEGNSKKKIQRRKLNVKKPQSDLKPS